MKTRLTTLLFLLLTTLCGTTAQGQTLVLWHPGGSTTDVELYTQPKVLFQDGKVIVTSAVANLEYDAKNILRFTYKGISTGISSSSVKSGYTQENDCLVFHDVKSTDKIALYKPNGIRIPARIIIQGTDAMLPIAQIPSGVYLLSVNGRTSKFTKK